ncbi:hypothetical protein RYX36_033819, partial [Vicia faba]
MGFYKPKGGRGKPKASKSVSRSSKSGLQFPVGRIARFLKAGKYAERVGVDAHVYLSVIHEYLADEVLELAGNAARDNKKSYINGFKRFHQRVIKKLFLKKLKSCKINGMN